MLISKNNVRILNPLRVFILTVVLLTNLFCSRDSQNLETNNAKFQNPYLIWDQTLASYQSDVASQLITTSDGNGVVVSFSSGKGVDKEGYVGLDDFWVVKFNSDGNIIWQNTIGGRGYDRFPQII